MWTKQKRKSIRGRFVIPILAMAFLSYFGFHTYHGEYGLYSKMWLEKQVKVMKGELASLTEKRIALEHQVALIRDGSIEKDMLDEQARRWLEFSQPNEVIIIRPRSARATGSNSSKTD